MLLVTSVLIALAVAAVVNIRTTPVYAARVTFFFTTPMTGAAELYPASMFSAGRLATYAALLTNEEIAGPLAAVPGVNLTPVEIAERITTEHIAETVLMEVTVKDQSRDRAMLIARALSVKFKDTVEALEYQPGVGSATRVEVVDGPFLEKDPVSPRTLDNFIFAIMVGLIVGATSAMVRETSDHTVRSADALQSLACAPVLARVPEDDDAPSSPGPFVSAGTAARTEALRQVRTLLQSAAAATSLKTLAVTSAVPREGRSATVCSLALLFAETGQRVLVVDAELRRPRLARFLGLDDTSGLSAVLGGTATLDQAIQPWGVGLWLLAGGHPPLNPSELLSSTRMTEMVDEVRRRYDVVIFDCPPLLSVTDGEVVAARADGTLLVVRAHRTTAAQVTAAVQALHAVNASLLGCVLNMVPGKDAAPIFDDYNS
ncbi:polysaccharide biosynthesis tyrosine autokinase [Actinoplanes sp. NEAU-A12]|uniref:Polysaccharide biosynthesis tyrosine autokinase n=1 Tax=Actinoplanes sandaracinus TaxID=3045177 RepID=A0ABT6WWC1_9ACTN|nr:polysaccharide biosynthesis tyrosine autokinase [Actinoplanes sandaracinus]MDI6104048.1 polysaccharide biosynthesis tyrosine autokinase [Actinoplanes sandaracinus]